MGEYLIIAKQVGLQARLKEKVIVTTPTYCMHVSAPLKSFIDMTFDDWMAHRPKKCMFSKRAVIVSTSAGADVHGNENFYKGKFYQE